MKRAYGDEMDTPERSKVAGTPISKFEVLCDSRGFFDRFEFHDSICFGGVLLVFRGGISGSVFLFCARLWVPIGSICFSVGLGFSKGKVVFSLVFLFLFFGIG